MHYTVYVAYAGSIPVRIAKWSDSLISEMNMLSSAAKHVSKEYGKTS